jgi:hypothetical protein
MMQGNYLVCYLNSFAVKNLKGFDKKSYRKNQIKLHRLAPSASIDVLEFHKKDAKNSLRTIKGKGLV